MCSEGLCAALEFVVGLGYLSARIAVQEPKFRDVLVIDPGVDLVRTHIVQRGNLLNVTTFTCTWFVLADFVLDICDPNSFSRLSNHLFCNQPKGLVDG